MCGHHVGTQRYVVAAIMPLIADAGEEILYFEVRVVGNSEPFEVEIDPSSLFLSRIEVDGNENPITSAGFAVADYVRVIDMVEVKRAVALEGWVVTPDLIHLRDQRSEAGACRAVPVTNLVLLAAWRMSGVLGQRLGWKKSATGGLVISSKYCSNSSLVLRQVK